jgi:hypothetical protein
MQLGSSRCVLRCIRAYVPDPATALWRCQLTRVCHTPVPKRLELPRGQVVSLLVKLNSLDFGTTEKSVQSTDAIATEHSGGGEGICRPCRWPARGSGRERSLTEWRTDTETDTGQMRRCLRGISREAWSWTTQICRQRTQVSELLQ